MSSSSNKALVLSALALALAATVACDDATKPPEQDTKVPKVVSRGCGGDKVNAKKGFIQKSMFEVRNIQRTYDAFVPDAHDGIHPIPVVFVFHEAKQKGADARASYPLEGAAGGKAIFVYPDAKDVNGWDVVRQGDQNADAVFYDMIRDSFDAEYCIDLNRTFVTGHAEGAYFANQLSCLRGGTIRAVAAHAGGGPKGEDLMATGVLNCPEKPVAAIITHGTDDQVVKLSEGQATKEHWARVNACRQGGLESFDPSPCIRLYGCASDRPVIYCEVAGLGHELWSEAPRATWSLFDSL